MAWIRFINNCNAHLSILDPTAIRYFNLLLFDSSTTARLLSGQRKAYHINISLSSVDSIIRWADFLVNLIPLTSTNSPVISLSIFKSMAHMCAFCNRGYSPRTTPT